MAGRRDELADLGQGFDRMTERLDSLMRGQRQLLHDVSHEMRFAIGETVSGHRPRSPTTGTD